MSNELVLFDLPTNGKPTCWSLNPWKTRLILNYKKIPYKTEWTNFDELAPKMRSLGVPPIKDNWKEYTIPAVQLPDGTIIMDSMPIAKKLDSLFPEPPLHFDTGVPQKVREAANKLTTALIHILVPPVVNILDEPCKSWFLEDRKKLFGMPMEEYAKKGDWEAAKPALEDLRDVLTKNKQDEGPFVLGSKVSYGDFIAVASFEWAKRLDTDTFKKLMDFDPSFGELHEACQPWLERDDH